MYIALLGRQPEISLEELKAVYGDTQVRQISPQFASIFTDTFDLSRLGGTAKFGKVVLEIDKMHSSHQDIKNLEKQIITHYSTSLKGVDKKITLGISAYDFKVSAREVQRIGLILKGKLKNNSASLRLVPNDQPALSSASSFNNKLGSSPEKIELLIVQTKDKYLVAESSGVQDIRSYTLRDHNRPKRDAFVGMLPPKLAQIMINLAVGSTSKEGSSGLLRGAVESEELRIPAERSSQVLGALDLKSVPQKHSQADSPDLADKSSIILDPFCGTGTVLQEAMLMGYSVIGTDLNPKMIDYTRENLAWLKDKIGVDSKVIELTEADATKTNWKNIGSVSAVVCETYLGQPFSAPPSPAKLKVVVGNCNFIISGFLKNISEQLKPGAPLCIAIPAWRDKDHRLTHLPLTRSISDFGFEQIIEPLIYARESQVVAREMLILRKK